MSPDERERLRLLLRATLTLAVIAGCVHLARSVDHRAVLRAVGGASVGVVVACAAINLGETWLRALAFSYLLRPTVAVPVGRLFRIALAGQAASNLLPWRLGDLVPITLLRTSAGVPTLTAVTATLMEKGAEAVTLLLLAAPLPLIFPGLPRWIAAGVVAQGVAGVGLLALGWVASSPRAPRWRFVPAIPEGARVLREPSLLARVLALALLQWVLDSLTVWLALRAVGVHAHPATPVLIELAFAAVTLVPSTPAQLGTLELVAVTVLALVGVDAERALAFALVYRAIDLLPITLIGLLVLPSFGGRSVLTPPPPDDPRPAG